jgi:hypothetical protein
MAKPDLNQFMKATSNEADEKKFENYSDEEVIQMIINVNQVTPEGAKVLFNKLDKEKLQKIITAYEVKQSSSQSDEGSTTKVPSTIQKNEEGEEKVVLNYEDDSDQSGMEIIPATELPIARGTPQLEPVITIDQAVSQYKMLRQIVSKVLVEGEDYGVPEAMKKYNTKPFLYKSGAAKLANIFGLRAEYEFIEREEDHVKFVYRFLIKCKLYSASSNVFRGESMGAASSDESRFKNRRSGADNWHNVMKQAEKRAFVNAVKIATRLMAEFGSDGETKT